jgi:hypothetical protein
MRANLEKSLERRRLQVKIVLLMVEIMTAEVVLPGDFFLWRRRRRWLPGSFMDFVGLLLRDLDTIFSLLKRRREVRRI